MAGSFWELSLVFLIILIFFGAGKLPSVMKDLGRSIKSLKDGLKEDDSKKEKDPKDPNQIDGKE